MDTKSENQMSLTPSDVQYDSLVQQSVSVDSEMDIEHFLYPFQTKNQISLSPPDIQGAAKIPSLDSLPEQSKKLYLSAYKSFVQWQLSKEITSFSESVLLDYFAELSTKYSPSTLWSNYSMLKSTIDLNHGINIDSYRKLKTFLKEKSQGFQPKKAGTFSPQHINEFLTKAPDHKYLSTKVAMIMGVMGSCLSNEMYRMKLDDVQDLGSAFFVKALNYKTKVTRQFLITDDFYQICKKYISLRPSYDTSDAFFLNYQDGKCTSRRIGINKFTQMGRQVATYLQLPNPEKYSAHSFRRSSSTIREEVSGDISILNRHGGWKSTTLAATVAEGCIDHSVSNKMEMAIQNPSCSEREETQINPNTTYEEFKLNDAVTNSLPSTITIGSSNRAGHDVIVLDDDKHEIKTEFVEHDVMSETNKNLDAVYVKGEPTEIKTEPHEEEIVENPKEQINTIVEDTEAVEIKQEVEDNISNHDNMVEEMYESEQETCINTNEDTEMVQVPQQLRQLREITPVKESANVAIPSAVEIRTTDIHRCDSYSQTDTEEPELTIDLFLEKNFQNNPSNISEAVSRMILIDEWVSRLTKYRQDMLARFTEPKDEKNTESKIVNKKRKIGDDAMDAYLNDIRAAAETSDEEECIEEITFNDIDYSLTRDIAIEFEKVNDVIVEMKNLEDKLVAGSDSGKIYIFDQRDGKLLQSLELPTRVPITSLLLINEQFCTTNMYIGTFRDHLYVYNFHTYQFIKRITVPDSVLCMDHKWEYIFIGCAEGWLQRYSIEKRNVEYEEKFQEGNILSLKAAVEGPRRILIVATEDSPLCIRDAITFLRLRLVARLECYVAQTITLYKNLICCTTNEGQLLILSFHKGAMVKSVKLPDGKGKHCTKLYRNVLFISRNSIVYLYDLKENQFIGDIKGPGGGIVSLNILRNQLIIGTNAAEFIAIPIDWNMLKKR